MERVGKKNEILIRGTRLHKKMKQFLRVWVDLGGVHRQKKREVHLKKKIITIEKGEGPDDNRAEGRIRWLTLENPTIRGRKGVYGTKLKRKKRAKAWGKSITNQGGGKPRVRRGIRIELRGKRRGLGGEGGKSAKTFPGRLGNAKKNSGDIQTDAERRSTPNLKRPRCS